ncbi:MAG TPA: dihydroneopterin aldolase [Burkholderiaceae bacterium]
MDTIFLRGLRAVAKIGIYHHERTSSRPVEIDLEFAVPGRRVFETGDVADTIDYAAVAERLRTELAQTRYGLLEEMSEAIAEILLREFGTHWVRVTVVKPGILGDVGTVGVSIERAAPVAARAQGGVATTDGLPWAADDEWRTASTLGFSHRAISQAVAAWHFVHREPGTAQPDSPPPRRN